MAVKKKIGLQHCSIAHRCVIHSFEKGGIFTYHSKCIAQVSFGHVIGEDAIVLMALDPSMGLWVVIKTQWEHQELQEDGISTPRVYDPKNCLLVLERQLLTLQQPHHQEVLQSHHCRKCCTLFSTDHVNQCSTSASAPLQCNTPPSFKLYGWGYTQQEAEQSGVYTEKTPRKSQSTPWSTWSSPVVATISLRLRIWSLSY